MSDHRIDHPQSPEAEATGWRFESDELENASYPFADDALDFHDGWSAIRRRRHRRPGELAAVGGGRRTDTVH